MKPIKLQIKKRITSYETNGYSYECDVYLNGQKLGHCYYYNQLAVQNLYEHQAAIVDDEL